ncbi:MAG TPA: hypothetical protein VKP88_04700 [Candidatus Paceibacterota bacterium]|nr:hypothetical protein [Candidatus Paceibacterota bacterium]
MKNSIVAKLRERDGHCWHCGATGGLVPHHRRNRGMGGSKLLDRLDNLMMVCSFYNGAMESDSTVAAKAREHGHKLSQWQGFDQAVFDNYSQCWYQLLDTGQKELINESNNSEPLF